MREDVCIVLNEREHTKSKAADSLEQKLMQQNITVRRLTVDENLEQRLLERKAPILVLDYLLGDLTTGLDILESQSQLASSDRPAVFFLTDEPSVQVAVQAMQLGAKNYFELESSSAIDKLVREIAALKQSFNTSSPKSHSIQIQPKLSDLIFQSNTAQATVRQIKSLLTLRAPAIVLVCAAGGGVSTIARAIHEERASNSILREVDLELETRSALEITGLGHSNRNRICFGTNLSLIVDHGEADDGELIDLFSSRSKELLRIIPPEQASSQCYLTICTSEHEIAKAWAKLCSAEIIIIPDLEQRRDDIIPLAQHFVYQALELSKIKAKPLDSSTLTWLSELDWPGQVRALRSAVFEGIISQALGLLGAKEAMLEARQRMLVEIETVSHKPNVLEVARTLERFGYRSRLAAAALGLSIGELERVMAGTE